MSGMWVELALALGLRPGATFEDLNTQILSLDFKIQKRQKNASKAKRVVILIRFIKSFQPS
jgi:hypothetical protein